jgi:AraC-like DNA-binding protein
MSARPPTNYTPMIIASRPSSSVEIARPSRAGRAWSAHVRRLCVFMRAHYHEPISLELLAACVGRNAAYTATLFHRQTGTTIHRYLTRVRMRRAAALLRRAEKVEAVMLQVGYRGKKNFYRQFEMAFGVTPGQYKANHGRIR